MHRKILDVKFKSQFSTARPTYPIIQAVYFFPPFLLSVQNINYLCSKILKLHYTIFMKKLFPAFLCLFILGKISAQDIVTTENEKSLYERVSNVENKTDKFHLYLNIHGSFDSHFNDESFQQGAFNMHQLRIQATGNINDWLSYNWRQRLNRSNSSENSIDNLPTSVDIAGIGIKFSDKFSMFAGRQFASFGGIEYYLNPIEVYEFSDMNEYLTCFLTGVNFAYDFNPKHQLQFQILNGLNHRFEKTYNSLGIEASKLPLMYSLNWNGNLLDGAYKTRWSASLTNQAKEQNIKYFAFGNEIFFNSRANMFFDVMYSREGLDNKGIISNIVYKGEQTALDSEYLSFVAKANYSVQPNWNLFIKGMYETASVSNSYKEVEEGKYRTSYGYLAGIEYYPMQTNLHFYLAYIGRKYIHENRAKTSDYLTHRVSMGFIYQLPMF